MKITKEILKRIINEELGRVLNEEYANDEEKTAFPPELTMNSSSSGEKRFWLKIGSKFYQLHPDQYEQIQNSGSIKGIDLSPRRVMHNAQIEILMKDRSFKPVRSQ